MKDVYEMSEINSLTDGTCERITRTYGTYETHELRRYTKSGLPCFCHFGYIVSYHTPNSRNFHRDIEIILCTKGEGTTEYGEREVDFCEGDIVVVNSGVPHTIKTNSYVEYYFLIIDPKFHSECGYAPEEVRYNEKIKDTELSDIYMKIVEVTHTEDKFRGLKTRLECSKLILKLFERYSHFKKTAEKPYAVHGRRVMEYLTYNYASQITVDDVAKYVGINRTRLAREFKQYTERTILEQLNIIRCENARRLIESNERISVAAERCGFENQSYFTKTYKKYIGTLPSESKRTDKR